MAVTGDSHWLVVLTVCLACARGQVLSSQSQHQDCKISNIFTGSWNFSSQLWSKHTPNQDGFAECPKTFSLMQARYAQRHGFGGYHPAHFERSDGCKSLPLEVSLKEMLLRNETSQRPAITVVGDSLSHQLFIQIVCALESVNQLGPQVFDFSEENSSQTFPNKTFIEGEDGLEVKYIYSRFLREGLPCQKLCFPWKRNKLKAVKLQYACSDCPQHTSITNYTLESLFSWTKEIHSATKILILQAGAWYTNAETPSDGLTYRDEFAATIPLLGIMLGIMLRERPDMEVFWVDMPPYVPNSELVSPCPLDHSQCHLNYTYNPIWGRELNKQRSDYVRAVFAAQGHPRIHVLNTHDALRARILGEVSRGAVLSQDGLHWKSPGPLSVPLFVFESIMHLYATRTRRAARVQNPSDETLELALKSLSRSRGLGRIITFAEAWFGLQRGKNFVEKVLQARQAPQ